MTNHPPTPCGEPPDRAPAPTHRSPSSDRSRNAHPDDLRRQLRLRLQHHLDRAAFRPALTVVGLRGPDATVLRHGMDRPEDAILGFVLPATYSAIGVLASSVVTTPPDRRIRDAALALGVGRGGEIVSLLSTHDGIIDTREPQGWLIDACLRAVGRPTPPCDVAALEFSIALWLDRLMVAILDGSTTAPLSWKVAVDLCPVPNRWRSTDPVDLGITLASTTQSWKTLRGATAQGLRSPAGITPKRARWMDDGMFARWCLGSFPDLNSLRSDVEFLASPDVAERVERTLRAAWSGFVS